MKLRAISQLVDSGDLVSADRALKFFLLKHPADADALYLQAVVQTSRGANSLALDSLQKCLAFSPKHALGRITLASLQAGLGHHDEASRIFDEILRDGDDYSALLGRGVMACKLDRQHEAISFFERAASVNPEGSEAYTNKGLAMSELGLHAEAAQEHERALALRPDYETARINLSASLAALNRYEESLREIRRVLEMNPASAEAWLALGTSASCMRQDRQAEEAFGKALSLKPNFAEAHWNRSVHHLRNGDLIEGWEGFEWRFAPGCDRVVIPKLAAAKRLSELRDFTRSVGPKVLVSSEQGFGDCIQFCRFVPELARLGYKVFIEAPHALTDLLGSLPCQALAIPVGEDPGPVDFRVPLLSLPRLFGTTVASIPSAPFYLRAPDCRIGKWRNLLGEWQRPRVGVVWRGNRAHKNDHNRSMPIESFAPLFSCEANFFPILPDLSSNEFSLLQEFANVHPVLQGGDDFSDSAALISLLDLVITVDTSSAHLSGALGLPTWVLLPRVPDWRWLWDTNKSPWYPSALLFRQDESASWEGVMRRVSERLHDFLPSLLRGIS